MTKPYSKTRILVEGAMMIALATVLSYIPIFQMPHGGTITLVAMLPIVVMALRHGTKWGLFTAFVHSLLQLLLGLDNLAYCATLGAQIGCVLFDYLLAYTALGLAGAIAKPFKRRLVGAGVATLAVCLLRFVCSTLSGYIVWKDYSYATEWMNNFSWGASLVEKLGENALCWVYSFFYNASYMLPETLLTVAAVALLCKALPKQFERV